MNAKSRKLNLKAEAAYKNDHLVVRDGIAELLQARTYSPPAWMGIGFTWGTSVTSPTSTACGPR